MEAYQEKKLFLRCSCDTEALEFQFITLDTFNKEIETEMWIAYWQMGYNDPKTLSIWTKLKMAFHVLKNGTLYGDQVILSKTNILKLKEWINSLEVE